MEFEAKAKTPSATTRAAQRLGQLLDGRYRIERVIGKGGMGTVYLAEHVLLRRNVAIKTLHPELSLDPNLIVRFHREAVAAAKVGNPHIVEVTDMSQLEDGTYYLALELLNGVDVGEIVTGEGPLRARRAVHIGLQLCEALEAVHAAGIVHRDLKPENLFLIQRGDDADFLKVLDFGICMFRDRDAMTRITGSAVAIGTPHFMPPEQIDGSSGLDHRADLYAVGANLYFMLTAETPYVASSVPALFHAINVAPTPDLRRARPNAPEQLASVLARAMHKRPAERYASARELYDALAAIEISDPQDEVPPRLRCRDASRAAETAETLPGDLRARGSRASSEVSAVATSGARARRPCPGATRRRMWAALALGGLGLSAAVHDASPRPAAKPAQHQHAAPTLVSPHRYAAFEAPEREPTPASAATSTWTATAPTESDAKAAASADPGPRRAKPPRVRRAHVSAPAARLDLPAADQPPDPPAAPSAPVITSQAQPQLSHEREPPSEPGFELRQSGGQAAVPHPYRPSARELIHVFDSIP